MTQTTLRKFIGSREKESKINEDSWTRWKIKQRVQEIERIKFDIAQGHYEGQQVWEPYLCGTHQPRRSHLRKILDSLKELLP